MKDTDLQYCRHFSIRHTPVTDSLDGTPEITTFDKEYVCDKSGFGRGPDGRTCSPPGTQPKAWACQLGRSCYQPIPER